MSPPYKGFHGNDTRERTMINETAIVGLGHVQADREAADGTDERGCAHLVVPAPARRGR